MLRTSSGWACTRCSATKVPTPATRTSTPSAASSRRARFAAQGAGGRERGEGAVRGHGGYGERGRKLVLGRHALARAQGSRGDPLENEVLHLKVARGGLR